MLDRRAFIATAAAAAVIPILPAIADTRPDIGTEFCVGDWFEPSFVGGRTTLEVLAEVRNLYKFAFRRVEKEHGVRLGKYKQEADYHCNRQAWFVVRSAIVVGYV